jgi:hypothetical protein
MSIDLIPFVTYNKRKRDIELTSYFREVSAMSAMEQYRFTLRIHPLIMEKMKYIAETNGRSVNKEIEQILKWVISDYENKRGRIHVDEQDQPGFRGTRTNKEELRRLEEQAKMRNRPISSALFKIK